MGIGRGAGGLLPPWILKLLANKSFFQFQGVKNKLHHYPLEKILGRGRSLTAPPGKNPSDAHECECC